MNHKQVNFYRDKPIHSVSESVDFYSELQKKVLLRDHSMDLEDVEESMEDEHC